MGKSAPSPPPAPDYAGAATAQGAANVDAARLSGKLSNPNVYGPLGSQTVTFNNDQPTVTQTLTPTAQQTLDAQQRVQLGLADLGQQGLGTAQNALANPFESRAPSIQTGLNTSGVQPAPGLPNAPNLQSKIDTSGVAPMPVSPGMTGQAAIMSRLQPQITQMENSNRQVLANQGIPQGSEAWTNAMRQQGNQENDLLSQAALQGINLDMSANNQGYGQAANNAQFANSAATQGLNNNLGIYGAGLSGNQQGFGQALTGAQFGNTAAAQSLQQQLALRNQPLNEITGLMSGSQIQMPQFQGYTGSNVAPAPMFGAAQAQGQNAMQNYGIASSNVNAANAGMYDLLGSGISAYGAMNAPAPMFSDRRLKSDIRRIATHRRGFGIYEYMIFGRRERGVIAQEVRNIMPNAVTIHESGFLMVDYGALDG